jgi:hypothetical protein
MNLNLNQLNFLLEATMVRIKEMTDEIGGRSPEVSEDEVRRFQTEIVDMIHLREELYRVMRLELQHLGEVQK